MPNVRGIQDIIQRCWDSDPDVRPSASELTSELAQAMQSVAGIETAATSMADDSAPPSGDLFDTLLPGAVGGNMYCVTARPAEGSFS